MKIIFEEKQRFNQWWVWAILVVCSVLCIGTVYQQYAAEGNFSGADNPDTVALSKVTILVLVLLLFVVLRMRTTITENTITVVYFPFVWKTIRVSDIASLEVINYGFVGGWGIRWFTVFGTVYNVRGTKGLHVKLKNGKQFVIGTQKPENLRNAIENLV